MLKHILPFLAILFFSVTHAQNVSINNDGSSPNARAILDIKSNSKGVLLPRMTTQQRNAIPVNSEDIGLMVFDTDAACLYIYSGTGWYPMPFSNGKDVYPNNYIAPDGEEDDHFGASVAIEGNYAVIGAKEDGLPGKPNSGSVYIYFHNGTNWAFLQKIRPSVPVSDAYFGHSVSISGDYIAVGAHGDSAGNQLDRGAVYIFARNGNEWIEQAKLTSGDGQSGDKLGYSVDISGVRVIAGAPGDDNGVYTNQGSSYFFYKNGNNWQQQSKLLPDQIGANLAFGESVSIDGNYLVIGSPDRNQGINLAGAAHIFHSANGVSNWTHQLRLFDNYPEFELHFGYSVSIAGDTIAIGAPGRTAMENREGIVYVYTRAGNTWSYATALSSPDPQVDAKFGYSVSVANGCVLVGATLYDEAGLLNSGGVFFYDKKNNSNLLSFVRKIEDVQAERVSLFGNAVALDRLSKRYIIGNSNANLDRGKVALGAIN
jgi:hypothetical protein